MRYYLENELLKIAIDSFGAELKSVYHKVNKLEYMWQADKTYWGRTSPVLFPFVGSVKNKQYIHEGTVYEMGQHGFARDMEFTLVSQTNSTIEFILKDTAETLLKYPFHFELLIGYELVGQQVKVTWKIKNINAKTMYFSIGAHPAFNCPIGTDLDKTGYQILFEGMKDIIHYHGNSSDGMAIMDDRILSLNNGCSVITGDYFDECTYMFENKQTCGVSILTPAGKPYVTVKFDTPLFAIWSPEKKNAPFLCIEPWYGRCDRADFHGELKDRDHTNSLEPKQEFMASYSMIFGE